MKRDWYIFSLVALLILGCTIEGKAQTLNTGSQEDTKKSCEAKFTESGMLYFRFDKAVVDSGYMDNPLDKLNMH